MKHIAESLTNLLKQFIASEPTLLADDDTHVDDSTQVDDGRTTAQILLTRLDRAAKSAISGFCGMLERSPTPTPNWTLTRKECRRNFGPEVEGCQRWIAFLESKEVTRLDSRPYLDVAILESPAQAPEATSRAIVEIGMEDEGIGPLVAVEAWERYLRACER